MRNEKEACAPYDPHGLSSFSFFLSSLIMLLRNEKEACTPYDPHGLSPFSFNNVFFISPLRKREFLGEGVVAEVLSFGEFYDLALE